MLATPFLGPHTVFSHLVFHITSSSPHPIVPPTPASSPLLIPIMQSQVVGLGLRAAVPSAIHILHIEHKTLNLWEGQSGNIEGPSGCRSQEEV